eukprot:Em0001g1588a
MVSSRGHISARHICCITSTQHTPNRRISGPRCSFDNVTGPFHPSRNHQIVHTWLPLEHDVHASRENGCHGPPGQSCGVIYVSHLLYQYPALPCLVPLLPADPCSRYQRDGHSLCHPCKTIQVFVAVISFLHHSREGGTEPNAETGHPGYAAHLFVRIRAI